MKFDKKTFARCFTAELEYNKPGLIAYIALLAVIACCSMFFDGGQPGVPSFLVLKLIALCVFTGANIILWENYSKERRGLMLKMLPVPVAEPGLALPAIGAAAYLACMACICIVPALKGCFFAAGYYQANSLVYITAWLNLNLMFIMSGSVIMKIRAAKVRMIFLLLLTLVVTFGVFSSIYLMLNLNEPLLVACRIFSLDPRSGMTFCVGITVNLAALILILFSIFRTKAPAWQHFTGVDQGFGS